MNVPSRNVAILGATGSIGKSALDVISASEGRLRPFAITAHRRVVELARLARRFEPRYVVVTDREAIGPLGKLRLPSQTELLVGKEGLEQVVRHADVDVVLAAIVGAAGIESTWAAVQAGKIVALANKEALVFGGRHLVHLARETGATVLPVDSEHSAIFQALACGRKEEVSRVLLTASGGPFRDWSAEALQSVTVEEALAHPTWNMGPKITVDSATMMNKALEIIEARWLFELEPDQISVLIHPQSIVHSLVEFVDGATIAQLSPPDMMLPIQFALEYPHRRPCPAAKFDWSLRQELEFYPPDLERCGALVLGYDAARAGGTAGAALNAANEAAVAAFLDGELHFTEIVPACRSVLQNHSFSPEPTLDELHAVDRWARQEVTHWVCT
jgi:1-deoxy-D-xylulose-5-phosphate reductoisomerase